MLRIASVNVNGIRAAFRRGMGEWLAARRPHVLALQEVRAGYEHLVEHLGAGWHVAHEVCEVNGRAGVAVASRLRPSAVRVGLGPRNEESSGRWVEVDVDLPGGEPLTVASVYVHKGEAGSERMAAKYAFLEAITARLGELRKARLAVVAGDLNVAHRHVDLKNWAANRAHAGFLPEERGYLDRWLGEGLGWVDVARRLAGEVPGPYTWWSWRGRAYDADSGWRIDYQLASPSLAAAARAAAVDRAPTYAERFSDHAPLVVDYDLGRS